LTGSGRRSTVGIVPILTRRRLWLAGLLAIPVLVAAAVAYACTPTAYIAFDKPSYRPGDTVTVNGRLFEPKAARPAEVRFGPDQAVVGRASIDGEGSWALSFSLPQGLSPGAYLVTAPAYDQNDQIVKVARASLRVAAPSTPAPASPAQGGASKPSTDRKEAASKRAGRETASRPVGRGPAPAAAAPARSPQLAEGRSVAGVRGAVSGRAAARVDRKERTASPTRPSERAATADLWGRLASGSQPSLLPSDASPPPDGPGTQLLVGIGLLAAGLVALASGFAVAEVRRRRSRVRPKSR
jgi:hypothetical protein